MALDSISTSYTEKDSTQNLIIKSLFNKNINQNNIVEILKDICNIDSVNCKTLIVKSSQYNYKKYFQAQLYGKKIWIEPSWDRKKYLKKNDITVSIDPGLGFGTGSHPTTKMCLEYLDSNPIKEKKVIDYGSGTGILAIVAAKLGARSVVAVDNDKQAIIATNNNIVNNNCKDIIKVYQTQENIKLAKCDLLIANILFKTLIELAETFSNLVQTSGYILLSGILDIQLDKIIQKYSKNFNILEIKKEYGWCLIIAQKI